jgi:hypothetical protein
VSHGGDGFHTDKQRRWWFATLDDKGGATFERRSEDDYAPGVFLHGTSSEFEQFKVGGHGLTYFSEASERGRTTQAEHIAGGPFGGWLLSVRIKKGKLFDPYNDPIAKSIVERLGVAHRGGMLWPDYVDAPAVVNAAKPLGYNRFRFYEASVQGFSEAVSDPSLIEVIERRKVSRR